MKDLVGQNFLDFVHPDDVDNTINAMIQLENLNPILNFTNRYRHKDGTYRYIEWRSQPYGGTLIYAAARDITERMENEKARINARIEQERMQLLQKFIQNAAHEFRTPLSVIGSSAFLMQRTDDADKRTRHMTQVQGQISRMTKLIDMLLLAVKLDAGIMLSFEKIDLAAFFHSLLQELPTDGPEVALRIPPDIPAMCGNVNYLREAMIQLIDNARRYSPQDAIVMVRVQLEGADMVRICVQDSGAGIDEATREQMFDAFWRQDEAHTTPGMGLGLTIAKKIINLHGGAIQVESTAEQGTTFRVYLPICQPT